MKEIVKIVIHYEENGESKVAGTQFPTPIPEEKMSAVYCAIKDFYNHEPIIRPNNNEEN